MCGHLNAELLSYQPRHHGGWTTQQERGACNSLTPNKKRVPPRFGKETRTFVTWYGVPGGNDPVMCLMDFGTHFLLVCKRKKAVDGYMNSYCNLRDLCKLRECVLGQRKKEEKNVAWLCSSFSFLGAETLEANPLRKGKRKRTLMRPKPRPRLSFRTSKHTWWKSPKVL